MRLFETTQQTIVEFVPGEIVTMYTCGITPNYFTHLGHIATYLTYDVLQRRLRDLGHWTQCVRNISDIPQAFQLARARSLGVESSELTSRVMKCFAKDCDALALFAPYKEIGAMSMIDEMIRSIEVLLDRGYAYCAPGFVYFDVDSCEWFGRLCHLSDSEMQLLMCKSEGTLDRPGRRGSLDFALWQRVQPTEPEWDSPWGKGRPGWHIQCATLAIRELGETIDLHGGGEDLAAPHHECEAAVAEALTGKPLARHWMHSGNVMYGAQKMSKSFGNLVFVNDLLERWEPSSIRLMLLSRHYRAPWHWNPDLLPVAARRLESWRRAGPGNGALDDVRAALDNDLDTPSALAAIDRAASAGQGVSSAAALLGVALAPEA